MPKIGAKKGPKTPQNGGTKGPKMGAKTTEGTRGYTGIWWKSSAKYWKSTVL